MALSGPLEFASSFLNVSDTGKPLGYAPACAKQWFRLDPG